MQRKIIKTRKTIKQHWNNYLERIGEMYKDCSSNKIMEIIEPEKKYARVKIARSIKEFNQDKCVIMSFKKDNQFLYLLSDMGFQSCNKKGEVI